MARTVLTDAMRRPQYEPLYDIDPRTGATRLQSINQRRNQRWQTVRNRIIIRTVDNAESVKHMDKSHLKLVTPATVKRTVIPKRPPNGDLRTREYMTETEVERLMAVTKGNRWGHRDATMVLVAYRHGLRASELVDLRWDQVDFRTATLHVRRVKQGTPSTHPILGDELRALRRLQREQEPRSPFVFTSERATPFTTAGFARMVERAGADAKMGFKAHPHMLRHACGFALANAGHDTRALQAYLGHKNIQHTVRYTELAPDRFKNFWND
ncbi:MAG: tyrosine-type recombinase/integrase [Xanthobacteraceae bacterium]